MAAYERLSFLDNSFLLLESRTTHMHVGAVTVLEAGSLRTAEGGVDVDRIRRYLSGRIHMLPRYRQVLARTPVERHPIWVDDQHFSIDYHVRHTSLPIPGTLEQLDELAGRIFSQQLNRAKPLWELWVVEGLEGGRVAIISKIHHCMIDGMGGVDLMGLLMNFGPSDDVGEPKEWQPRPIPSGAELMVGETARLVRKFLTVARDLRSLPNEAAEVAEGLTQRVAATTNALRSGWLTSASRTPITQPIGPNRRFGRLDLPLSDVKAIKDGLGGTVNDVLLATVAGAVRQFLLDGRDFALDDVDFRVMAPVSVRTSDGASSANQVAMWLLALPVGEPDPVERLRTVQQETEHLKVTNQALGASTLVKISSGAPGTLVSLASRLATGARPFNMTVTNVPGPQMPLYFMSARLEATYPLVPLWNNHGLGVAIFSYNGAMHWGLNADWDLVPDLAEFKGALEASFAELRAAAEGGAARSARKAAARKPAAAKQPAARKPAARKPAARKPAARKPAARKPAAAKQPAARKPAAAKQPAARKPATKATAAKKPAAKSPAAAKKPAAAKPTAKKPAAAKAAAAKTATAKKTPTPKKPAAKQPAGKTPAAKKPAAARKTAAPKRDAR